MPSVKEIELKEFNKKFSNDSILKEAFSTIKNATLVRSNDTELVVNDEDSQVLYEARYEIDHDLKEVHLKDVVPLVIKEERYELSETYVQAMNESLNEEEAVGLIRGVARKIARQLMGGDKKKMIREARSVSVKRSVDKGRKIVLEELGLFKAKNVHLLNQLKSNGFYEKFAEKLNAKYLGEDSAILIDDRLNFNLIERKGKANKSVVFKKRISKEKQLEENIVFNPIDVLKNSPSFSLKFKKFMDNVDVLKKSEKDKNLEESKEAFANFASNWPVLYLLSESKHKEFALKYFTKELADNVKARNYVDNYGSLVESEQFKKDQVSYLAENYNLDVDGLEKQEKHFNNSFYNAKIVDNVRKSISDLRESVTETSVNVANYLKFAEEQMDKMLRTGKFNEELFERISTDIFGDAKLVIYENESDHLSDPDFKRKGIDSLSEDERKDYELQTRANALVVRLRESINSADRSVKLLLEEDLDLVKSMIAINRFEVAKLDSIESILSESKESKSDKVEVVSKSKEEGAWCPSCFEKINHQISEAKSLGKEQIACASCGAELKV